MKLSRAIKYKLMNLMVPLAVGALKALGATLRRRARGQEHVEAYLKQNRAGIAAFLHCDLPAIALWGAEMARRGRPVTVLTSPSNDGRIFARFLRSLGLRTVQGSSSRGGAQGMLALAHALGRGHHIGIVVDGPRGPRAEVKPGVIWLSRRLGAPIVAIAARPRPRLRLPTWDRAEIPLPFARCEYHFSEPWTPPQDLGEARRVLAGRLLEMKGELAASASALGEKSA